MTLSRAPPAIRQDAPPSCKLVWMALDDLGEAQYQDLLEWTQLPRRTLGDALKRLEDDGVLTRESTGRDCRQTLYRLKSRDETG